MNNEISQATIMMSQPNVKNIMEHWPMEAMLGRLRGQLTLIPSTRHGGGRRTSWNDEIFMDKPGLRSIWR